ncbi:MAG: PqqD family protein [Nitrospirae bacterium]|nr:PqqD family protein [Nitrospirota bacterium]
MSAGNGVATIRRSPDVAHRIVDGEAVIVDPSTQEVHILNETGSFVWSLADGSMTAGAMAQRLSDAFEVDAETALKDVEELLATLTSKKLLVAEGGT